MIHTCPLICQMQMPNFTDDVITLCSIYRSAWRTPPPSGGSSEPQHNVDPLPTGPHSQRASHVPPLQLSARDKFNSKHNGTSQHNMKQR